MPYIKAADYTKLQKKIQELNRECDELKKYKKLYFKYILETEEPKNSKVIKKKKKVVRRKKKFSCECFKHGKDKCCREKNCKKCGSCMLWQGYSRDMELCINCKSTYVSLGPMF